MLFKNICENTYGWKNILKYVKCCLKSKNGCLKIQTKHPHIFLTVPCVTRFLAGLHITHSFYFLMWSHILFFLFLFNKFIFVHLINRKQKKVEKSNPISKSISETLCHSWTTLSCETIAIQHVWLKSYGVVVFVSASSEFQQLRITNWDYYAH